MIDFLKRLGINSEGETTSNGSYVIDISDSDEFNKIFSKLDKSELIEENEDSSVVNVNVSNILYFSDKFSLNLIADFKQDIYKLVVTDLEDFDNEEEAD